VIVVIGHPVAEAGPDGRRPAGSAALTALAAARAGAATQLVGKVGDDDAGDELVLQLAREGVGHVALLRDPSSPTPVLARDEPADDLDDPAPDPADPADVATPVAPSAPAARPTLDAADVDLGLRYLTDFRAIVVPEPVPAAVLRVVADAAAWAGAELIVVTADPAALDVTLPDGALVLAAVGDDPEGTFPALLGRVAAAVDAGATASAAFAEAAGRLGATRTD